MITQRVVPTLILVLFAAKAFGQSEPSQLAETLQRAGERVQRYTSSILSVVCTEVTKQQELEPDLKTTKNKPTDLVYDFIILPPQRAGLSIQEMRELKLVNGKPPQRKPRSSFPDPTAYTTSIVMLLPEPIVLPESAESLRVIQGSRVPRLRTTHSFKDYRRFTSEIKFR